MTPIIPWTGSGLVVIGYYEADLNCLTPTAADIISIIGDPGDYATGSVFLIKDINGGCAEDIYFITTDGVSWYVNSAVFSEAT